VICRDLGVRAFSAFPLIIAFTTGTISEIHDGFVFMGWRWEM
jgi:hypothetical protein